LPSRREKQGRKTFYTQRLPLPTIHLQKPIEMTVHSVSILADSPPANMFLRRLPKSESPLPEGGILLHGGYESAGLPGNRPDGFGTAVKKTAGHDGFVARTKTPEGAIPGKLESHLHESVGTHPKRFNGILAEIFEEESSHGGFTAKLVIGIRSLPQELASIPGKNGKELRKGKGLRFSLRRREVFRKIRPQERRKAGHDRSIRTGMLHIDGGPSPGSNDKLQGFIEPPGTAVPVKHRSRQGGGVFGFFVIQYHHKESLFQGMEKGPIFFRSLLQKELPCPSPGIPVPGSKKPRALFIRKRGARIPDNLLQNLPQAFVGAKLSFFVQKRKNIESPFPDNYHVAGIHHGICLGGNHVAEYIPILPGNSGGSENAAILGHAKGSSPLRVRGKALLPDSPIKSSSPQGKNCGPLRLPGKNLFFRSLQKIENVAVKR